MMGYLNKPRSAYYDDDGFGMTGDIGYYSESGVVYYVDRVKEIIKLVNAMCSWTWVGLTLIRVFHYLAQLPSRFCQIPISQIRIEQNST